MSREGVRSWGFWTQAKLKILADYLPAFLTASKRSPERVYLDAFAGEGRGVDRLTGEEFSGSARIALDADGGAVFTRLFFFEREDKAQELHDRLLVEFPGRQIGVVAGDCNASLPRVLEQLRQLNLHRVPTFAFIDPDGMEFGWQTLRALADHKRGHRPSGSTKPEYKVEFWLLFPTMGLVRTLSLDRPLSPVDEERATRLYGTDAWREVHRLRRNDELSGAEAKDEYVNLMRWRLERSLGYRSTHSLELKNQQGGTIYHMIFATDHPAGEKIMGHLYGRALVDIPEMRREARDHATGQMSLAMDLEGSPVLTYRYEPPRDPLGGLSEAELEPDD